MPVAPRGASASPSEALPGNGSGWPSARRLRRPGEFSVFVSPGSPLLLRASRKWLAVSVRVSDAVVPPEDSRLAPGPACRVGLTVPRRQASRAVARNMVKRVLRESARHWAPSIDASCVLSGGHSLDILLRLKAPLPKPEQVSWSELKRALRLEADSLLAQVRDQCAGRV